MLLLLETIFVSMVSALVIAAAVAGLFWLLVQKQDRLRVAAHLSTPLQVCDRGAPIMAADCSDMVVVTPIKIPYESEKFSWKNEFSDIEMKGEAEYSELDRKHLQELKTNNRHRHRRRRGYSGHYNSKERTYAS